MFISFGSSASGGEVSSVTLSPFQFRLNEDVGPPITALLNEFGFP